jgi:hypothetical protein
MRNGTRLLFMLIAMLLVGAAPALADVATFTLNTGNSALSGVSGPFGTVMIDLTSSTMATITFTADSGFLFGGVDAVDANINATSWAISGLTGTVLSGFSGPSLSKTGSGTVDGFGVLNLTFKEFDGFTWALNSVSFKVTDKSGTWANAASVLTANGGGFDAAAHIFVCGNVGDTAQGPCVQGNGALVTGFATETAGSGSPPPTPEPATLLLLGTGLCFLGGALRRRMIAAA